MICVCDDNIKKTPSISAFKDLFIKKLLLNPIIIKYSISSSTYTLLNL